MANKVLLKKSSVAAKVPLTTDLDYGELALNYADEKLYFKNSANLIKAFNATQSTLTIGTGLSGTSYNGSSAVTIAIDSTVTTLTGTQTLTNKTLTSPRVGTGVFDTNGNEVLNIVPVAAAVNELSISNAATGGSVLLTTAGGDANINLLIQTKGTGSITLDTGIGAGFVDIKPGLDSLRLYDDDSSHYYRFVTGNIAANYDITLPAGSVTLTAGTSVVTTRSISTNNGLTGGGDLSADRTLGLTGQALALHNLATNGIIARTGAGTVAGRTITASTGISIANGDGVSGNPTITNSAPDQTVVLTGSGATSISGTYPSFTISSTNTTYSAATSTVLGLIEIFSDTVQTVAATAVSATAARTYGIQVNSAGQAVVNVPWVDTNTTYSAGSGITLTTTTFSVAAGTGLTQDAGGLSLTAITAGNATVGALRYNSTTAAAGQLDGGTTNPTGTTRLNYGGYLHSTINYASAGTVALPAFSTSGDTNTGIFFPAADTLAFVEGGVEIIRINSSGNVGVGTTAPAYKLEVNGSFAATTKSFVIDHPTKPGKKLRYGSLEGPENGIYIRGKTQTNVIELPEYWTALVDPDSITVQLTPIGRHQKLYVEKIEGNKVYIANDNMLNTSINCFYYILAERADVEKLEVEIG